MNCLAFSPDLVHFVAGFSDRLIVVWDVVTGGVVQLRRDNSAAVTCAAYSPDDQHLLTGSSDGSAALRDARTLRETQTLKGHSKAITSAAFSGDGKRAVTVALDYKSVLWDTATGKKVLVLSGDNFGDFSAAAFRPDNRQALIGRQGSAVCWNTETGEKVQTFPRAIAHPYPSAIRKSVTETASRSTERFISVAYRPDGRQVLTGVVGKNAGVGYSLAEQYIVLWDAESGEELRRFAASRDATVTTPLCARFLGDGARIMSVATRGRKQVVTYWDPATGQAMQDVEAVWGTNTHDVKCAAISPDATKILSGSRDGKVVLWDAATGRELRAFFLKESDLATIDRGAGVGDGASPARPWMPNAKAQDADFRTWRDISRPSDTQRLGAVYDAVLLGVEGGKVRLRGRDGEIFTLPIGLLSPADKEFLNSLGSDKKPDAARPTYSVDLDVQIGSRSGVIGRMVPSTNSESERRMILFAVMPILQRVGYTLKATPEQREIVEAWNRELSRKPGWRGADWKIVPAESTPEADLRLRISAAFSSEGDNPIVTRAKWRLRCETSAGHDATADGRGQYASRGGGPARETVQGTAGAVWVIVKPGGSAAAYEPGLALADGGFVLRLIKTVAESTGVPEKDVLLGAIESTVESAYHVPFVRAQASWRLVKLGELDYIQAMFESDLHGVTETLASTAREGRLPMVVKMGERAVPFLIEMLCDPYSRYKHGEPAKYALWNIGKPAVPALIEVVHGDRYPDRAAWVLGEIKDPRAIEPLIAAANRTSYPGGDNTRKQMIYALGRFRAQSAALKALRQIAEHDPSSVCRETATEVLKQEPHASTPSSGRKKATPR